MVANLLRIFNSIFLILVIITCEIRAKDMSPMISTDQNGSCPPLLPMSVCYDTCRTDLQCPGARKCCKTSCGGTVCSRAVTARSNTDLVKPGHCPSAVMGPWRCSSTCSSDSDCRSKSKCCKNRCGASVCATPIIPN